MADRRGTVVKLMTMTDSFYYQFISIINSISQTDHTPGCRPSQEQKCKPHTCVWSVLCAWQKYVPPSIQSQIVGHELKAPLVTLITSNSQVHVGNCCQPVWWKPSCLSSGYQCCYYPGCVSQFRWPSDPLHHWRKRGIYSFYYYANI